MVDCGDRHALIRQRATKLVEQIKSSGFEKKKKPLVTCLLEGPRGRGKSALYSEGLI